VIVSAGGVDLTAAAMEDLAEVIREAAAGGGEGWR
jgi:hypothetical protein